MISTEFECSMGAFAMRGLLLAAVMFGTAAGAQAADMPDFLRGSIAAPVTRSWDGWYAGGQVDYTSSATDYGRSVVSLTNDIFRNTVLQSPTAQLSLLGKANSQNSGFGGFVGRNWQSDDVVFGIEANYNYFTNLSSSVKGSLGPLIFPTPAGIVTPPNEFDTYAVTLSGNARLQVKDVLTLRGRAGWACGNFLPYMFGGLAVGRMDVARTVSSSATKTVTTFTTDIFGNTNVTSVNTFALPQFSQTAGEERTNAFVPGWTAGLGSEFMIWNGLFARAEWEYVKFLSVKNTVLQTNNLRLGLGYKF